MMPFLILFPSKHFLPTPKQNGYHMEYLQIIDNFSSSLLVVFVNMACIFMDSHKKRKDNLSFLHFLSTWFSYALYLLLQIILKVH